MCVLSSSIESMEATNSGTTFCCTILATYESTAVSVLGAYRRQSARHQALSLLQKDNGPLLSDLWTFDERRVLYGLVLSLFIFLTHLSLIKHKKARQPVRLSSVLEQSLSTDSTTSSCKGALTSSSLMMPLPPPPPLGQFFVAGGGRSVNERKERDRVPRNIIVA